MDTLRASWRQIEPWYLFMVILGAFNVGFCIMLVPQFVVLSFDSGLAKIGLIMAAWTAGPLVGPWFSKYIDKWGTPKVWLSGLFLVNACLAFAVQYSQSVLSLFVNMFIQGLIYAIGYSILNLLIVRRYEEKEWHGRTGMLIAAFIIGEVIGFGVAGRIEMPAAGFVGASIVMVLSSLLALVLVPDFNKSFIRTRSPEQRSQQVRKLLHSPFGIMALGWGLLCFAAQILFLPFPVLMREVFQIMPEHSSSVVSISGIIALSFYPIVGKLTERFGADNVLITSSAVKAMVFVVLAYCAFYYQPELMLIVLCMVFVNRCTWPFMMASSQIQAAQLSGECSKSMALTIFMAIASIGNFLSGVINSMVTASLGMSYIPLVAAITASVGVVLLFGNKYRELRHDQHIDQPKHYP
ncbi:MFS transporter [Vibrio parahaemolyticus]|nr:MFS transporter [Vibrio parahaemolyticus]